MTTNEIQKAIKPRIRLKTGQKYIRSAAYDGAAVNNLTWSWSTAPITADQQILFNLRPLRARSRELGRNNAYMRKFLTMVKNNVVGPEGFNFQAKPKDNDGSVDDLAATAIETAWKDWGKVGNCDVTGRLSFVEMCRVIMETVAQDGEIFVRRFIGKDQGPYNYRLQLLDPELVDVNYNEELRNGRLIRMGIEYNEFDAPVNYHIDKKTNQTLIYQPGDRVKVPANEIFHIYRMDRQGLRRGIPWPAASMVRAHMVDSYEEAALTNARVGASKMGFYTTPTGQEYVGDLSNNGELLNSAEPGSFEQLPEGIEFTAFNPDYPKGEIKDFEKVMLRGIASGLGVSYNSLANDLEGVNFSSLRAGLLDERDSWTAHQNWFIDLFLIPLYDDWIKIQLLSGTIRINGNPLDVARADKYKSVIFAGRRWQWVDPLKEVQAAVLAVDNLIESRSEIIRTRGNDPDEVRQEIAADNAKEAELGLQTKEGGENAESEPDPDEE